MTFLYGLTSMYVHVSLLQRELAQVQGSVVQLRERAKSALAKAKIKSNVQSSSLPDSLKKVHIHNVKNINSMSMFVIRM